MRLTPVLWAALAASAVYGGLLWYQLGTTQDALRQAQAREARLLEQLQALATMPARARGDARADGAEAIAIALIRQPGLIGHEPASGGRFYFLEDSVRVLSGRYAYAAFEDGDVTGHALIEYGSAEDGGLMLRVIDSYLNR